MKARFLRCIDLERRRVTRCNRCSYRLEELLLACRRADASHPHRLRRGVVELVRTGANLESIDMAAMVMINRGEMMPFTPYPKASPPIETCLRARLPLTAT